MDLDGRSTLSNLVTMLLVTAQEPGLFLHAAVCMHSTMVYVGGTLTGKRRTALPPWTASGPRRELQLRQWRTRRYAFDRELPRGTLGPSGA